MPTIAPEVSCRRARLWIGVALVVITAAVYWPVRLHEFITCDDPAYVTQNPQVLHGLTWPGVLWAFGRIHGEQTYWHPLTWMSHMLDCQLFGLEPGAHHSMNLFFHALNTLLVFLVFARLTGATWRCAVLAGLFALHPLQVDTVAWVAERKNLLSAFFGLLAIWAYLRYVEQSKVQCPKSDVQGSKFEVQASRLPSSIRYPPSSLFYLLSLLLFALSLMSKPALVTLPCVLLLLDYWPLNRFTISTPHHSTTPRLRSALPRLLLEKLPFLMLSGASSLITVLAHRGLGMLDPGSMRPLGFRLENALVSYARYLEKTLWPSKLAIFYPLPDAWPLWTVAISVLLFLAVTALAIATVRSRPYLFVGWFWFSGMLVPCIGLVQAGAQAMADRFAYLPVAGLFLGLVWTVAEWSKRWPQRKRVLSFVAIALLLLCAGLTRTQVKHWRNSVALFQHALAVTDDNAEAENNLATALARQGKLDQAITHYETALKLAPLSPSVHCNLGIVLAQRGGRMEEARHHLTVALQRQPLNVAANYHLASIAATQGRWGEAIAHYQQVLRLRPGFPEAQNGLGFAWLQTGRLEEAATELAAARKSRPGFAGAHYNLGMVRLQQGRPREAMDEFSLALRLRPDWAEVQNNLAWLLATDPNAELRDGPRAISLAERACQLTQGTNAAMVATLAASYAEAGRFPDAITTQEKACNLAAAQRQTNQVQAFQIRLEVYRSGHAYHRP